MNSATSLRPLAVTVAIVALALTGCAGKSTPTTAATTSPAADQTINITYAGGKVSGVSAVIKVKLKSTVTLVVTSDVADEVHVHGYDKMADVTKGGTVTIVFTATLPGKWEVELEKLKHRLVFLQVQ